MGSYKKMIVQVIAAIVTPQNMLTSRLWWVAIDIAELVCVVVCVAMYSVIDVDSGQYKHLTNHWVINIFN